MQRNLRAGGLSLGLCLVLFVCLAGAACARSDDGTPPVATAELGLSRQRIAQGSPVDVTFRFQVAERPAAAGKHRVFVHVVDADEELMWTDDHDPPLAPASWQPGQTVEYTRTMFVPTYPYIGPAKVILGVYDMATGERLKLGNADRGDRSYQLAQFELLPQTENLSLTFKEGWHDPEVASGDQTVEWRWTRGTARVTFRNPKRDATLLLQVDNPSRLPQAATELDVRLGERSLAVLPVSSEQPVVHKMPIAAAEMGEAEIVEVTLVANRAFVPARTPALNSDDSRELGVRVFQVHVLPNP